MVLGLIIGRMTMFIGQNLIFTLSEKNANSTISLKVKALCWPIIQWSFALLIPGVLDDSIILIS